MAEGIFAAFWSLNQAIKINPGGVAEPIQIMTLREAKNGWTVTELGQEDLEEHRQAIIQAEERLRTFREIMTEGAGAEAVPEPDLPS